MIRRALAIVSVTVCLLVSPAGASTPWYKPLLSLPHQSTVRCILWSESRSTYAHPNLSDTDPWQYGPFQFTTVLWNRWSWVAGVGRQARGYYLGSTSLFAVSVPAFRATLSQQARVFVVVDRNDGLGPWTRFDGC